MSGEKHESQTEARQRAIGVSNIESESRSQMESRAIIRASNFGREARATLSLRLERGGRAQIYSCWILWTKYEEQMNNSTICMMLVEWR